MLLLIIVLVLLFGGGGGYYGYSRMGHRWWPRSCRHHPVDFAHRVPDGWITLAGGTTILCIERRSRRIFRFRYRPCSTYLQSQRFMVKVV